jgi:hypothetical protein
MPKNASPPPCKKCGSPMRWLPAKTGGRKYRCLDCDGPDPLKSRENVEATLGRIKAPGVKPKDGVV